MDEMVEKDDVVIVDLDDIDEIEVIEVNEEMQ